MDNFCSICGQDGDVTTHDCLTQLLKDFKRLEVPTFLAGTPTEESLIEMRQKLKPIVEKIDRLRVHRQQTSAKFKRLEGEAEDKFNGLKSDLKTVTDILLEKLKT